MKTRSPIFFQRTPARRYLCLLAAALCCLFGQLGAQSRAAEPVSAAALRAKLTEPDHGWLLIDIRGAEAFQRGTIPGAIHIPEAFLPRRALPALTAAVLIDDGLGTTNARSAAGDLARRVAFPVYFLQGGFSTWLEAGGNSTGLPGLQPESLPRLTYRQLLDADLSEAVLFDVRDHGDVLLPMSDDEPIAQFAAARGLPLLRGNPVALMPRPQARGTGELQPASAQESPLIILIDDNNGEAEATARRLRANGFHRFVILTGGTEILRHEGRSGQVRRASGIQIEVSADQVQ